MYPYVPTCSRASPVLPSVSAESATTKWITSAGAAPLGHAATLHDTKQQTDDKTPKKGYKTLFMYVVNIGTMKAVGWRACKSHTTCSHIRTARAPSLR